MRYTELKKSLQAKPRTWLVTGCAGFIGSHLIETLLSLNQKVTGLDNFSTGNPENLREVERIVGAARWKNFTWIEGDICSADDCSRALDGVDLVLHQAALGSVPRSISDPLSTNRVNVVGFLEMLKASCEHKVKRFVYTSSSSVYGTNSDQIKREDSLGSPLSPYAASKRTNEIYAQAFSAAFEIECIGLRYFNVFGARQNPDGPYAAVIPRWLSSFKAGEDCVIFGDGETSRDFCYVDNVVQANLLAATAEGTAVNEIYNIAVGDTTSLKVLFQQLKSSSEAALGRSVSTAAKYEPFRKGDVRHSCADISKATELLGYLPSYKINQGLELTAAAFFSSK